METKLPVENGDTLKALQGFLQALLETGLVDALLVPMQTPYGTIAPALVSDPGLLSQANPLAPVLPVNGATLAGQLSVREPRARIGVVLRACELRALVELTKLQQASLEDLTLISIDCAGTYSVPTYVEKGLGGNGKEGSSWQELYRAAIEHPANPDPDLRLACQVCEQPVYEGANISIQLFGAEYTEEIHLSMRDELAVKLDDKAGQSLGDSYSRDRREKVVRQLVEARTARRDAEFTAMRARLEGEEGLAGVFAACIRCHNCMTVCPICYCKTCVFKSAIFDHEPMQYVNWARQKGALRMPADTVLFHLTRLNHMGLSCVGCGMCSEACPAELPVGLVFRVIGQRLQATFEYAPGHNPEEPLPLVTFKADEWTEVGE